MSRLQPHYDNILALPCRINDFLQDFLNEMFLWNRSHTCRQHCLIADKHTAPLEAYQTMKPPGTRRISRWIILVNKSMFALVASLIWNSINQSLTIYIDQDVVLHTVFVSIASLKTYADNRTCSNLRYNTIFLAPQNSDNVWDYLLEVNICFYYTRREQLPHVIEFSF